MNVLSSIPRSPRRLLELRRLSLFSIVVMAAVGSTTAAPIVRSPADLISSQRKIVVPTTLLADSPEPAPTPAPAPNPSEHSVAVANEKDEVIREAPVTEPSTTALVGGRSSRGAEWRRTSRGWEQVAQWQALETQPPAHPRVASVHPALIAAFQVLAAIGALIGFDRRFGKRRIRLVSTRSKLARQTKPRELC